MSYYDNSLVAVASFLTPRRMSVVICVSGGSQMMFHVPARRQPRRSARQLTDVAAGRDAVLARSAADQCDLIWPRDTPSRRPRINPPSAEPFDILKTRRRTNVQLPEM